MSVLGKKIIDRLQRFTETVERGESVAERFTCRKVTLDLEPTSYDAEMIKSTRKLLGVSQPLFAKFLGVSVKTVRAWEQGVQEPNEMACRFLDEIRADPEYWVGRLRQRIVQKTATT